MRRQVIGLAVILSALAIAACGSSKKPSRAASVSQGLKFAECMRSHGLPSFPDPINGGGFQFKDGSVNPASPAFQAARKACQAVLPGGGPANRPPATAQQKATMLHLSQCMRAHGVSSFPDPVSSPPANPAGFRLAFGSPGAFIAIPDSIDVESPAFKRAAQACQFPGAPHKTAA